jgi:predicted nucleic acid-binding protein
MILVDTSVWVDHLRSGNAALAGLLESGMVMTHPFVIGEIALGDLRQREAVRTALSNLPRATLAADAEVLDFIERHRFWGRGIGYIDAHLLAAVRLSAGSALWTNDKRLRTVAAELELAMPVPRRPHR